MSDVRSLWRVGASAVIVWLALWAVGLPFVDHTLAALPLWLPGGAGLGFVLVAGWRPIPPLVAVTFAVSYLARGGLEFAATLTLLTAIELIAAAALLRLWVRPDAPPWRLRQWAMILGLGAAVPIGLAAAALGAILFLQQVDGWLIWGMVTGYWGSHFVAALLLMPLAPSALAGDFMDRGDGGTYLAVALGALLVTSFGLLPPGHALTPALALGGLPLIALLARRGPFLIRGVWLALAGAALLFLRPLAALPPAPIGGELLPVASWVFVVSIVLLGHAAAAAAPKAPLDPQRTWWSLLEQLQSVAVIGTDAQGLVSVWNGHAERLYRHTPHQALGKPLGDLLREDPEWRPTDDPAAGASGTVRDVALPDGDELTVYSCTATLTGPDGPERYRFDIDTHGWRQHQAQEARTLDRENAARMVDAQARLAASVARELHTLTQTMIGHTDLALLELPQGHAAREQLQELTRACRDAEGVCRRLLQLSGRPPRDTRLTDLSAVVHANVSALQRGLRTNVALEATLGAQLPLVRIDRNQLREMLSLIITAMAAKAAAGGGTLQLTTYEQTLDRESIDRWMLGPHIRPGAYVICDVHLQSATTVDEPEAGPVDDLAGLGLALGAALGIARAHGGDLQALPDRADAPVRIWLPAAASPVN